MEIKNCTVDIKGQLDKQYKELAIKSVYGMMEGSGNSIVKHFRRRCKLADVKLPESILVQQYNTTASDGYTGTRFTVTVIDGDNEFYVYRDTSEEHDIDKLHPDYESDLWFFETFPPKDEGTKRCFTALQANGIPLRYIDETTWERSF